MRTARVVMAGLALASAGTALAQDAPFTLGNPDARLWARQDDGFQGATQLICRHAVCPRGTVVAVRQTSGPPRRPDTATLRRMASDDVPRALAGQAQGTPRLTPTTIQGWPAIRGTYQTGRAEAPTGAVMLVYLDGTTVQLTATSSDPAYAPRALEAVVAASRFRRP